MDSDRIFSPALVAAINAPGSTASTPSFYVITRVICRYLLEASAESYSWISSGNILASSLKMICNKSTTSAWMMMMNDDDDDMRICGVAAPAAYTRF
jgi:hypothetical protein